MKLKLALLLGLLSTNAVMAFDAAGIEPPALTDGHQNPSGKGCSAIRALKPAELPQPWRRAVTKIVLTCEPMEGVDKEPDAATNAVAILRPGAVNLRGIPVVELRHGASWAGDDVQHVSMRLTQRWHRPLPPMCGHVAAQRSALTPGSATAATRRSMRAMAASL